MFQMLHQMCTFNAVTTNLKKKMKNEKKPKKTVRLDTVYYCFS